MKTNNAWKKLNQPISEASTLGRKRSRSFALWFSAGTAALFWVVLCYYLGWATGSKATLVLIALVAISFLTVFLTVPRSGVRFQALSGDKKHNRKR
jgi:hypothetical protein